MDKDKIDFVKTPDTNLATVLYCLGFPIDGIHYSGKGKQMEFYFKDDDRLRKTMLDYSMRKLRVEPRELFEVRSEIIRQVKHEASTRKFKKN
jgi:hypothetical protein